MASGDVPPFSQGAAVSEEEGQPCFRSERVSRMEACAPLHSSHCGHAGREPWGSVPRPGSVGPGLELGFPELMSTVSRH